MSRFTVHDLAATIDARAASGGEASYTRKLLDKGAEHCAKKLGEEAVETVIASGGLASIEDVKAMLTPPAKKLEGAIAGRALYDGRLDPAAALALIRSARAAV